jgi:hypothetical protein
MWLSTGGSHRKRSAIGWRWDEINENKNIDIIKEKKRRENITTDVYILGQCNQVENKKEKKTIRQPNNKNVRIKSNEEKIKE